MFQLCIFYGVELSLFLSLRLIIICAKTEKSSTHSHDNYTRSKSLMIWPSVRLLIHWQICYLSSRHLLFGAIKLQTARKKYSINCTIAWTEWKSGANRVNISCRCRVYKCTCVSETREKRVYVCNVAFEYVVVGFLAHGKWGTRKVWEPSATENERARA